MAGFLRHVKPDLIVLYDDLAAPKPATFQFMLHGLSPFKIDEASATLVQQRPKASVTVRYLSPVPLVFKQTDGFEPKPQTEFPNLWHVEAGTRAAQKTLGMLTVLAPARAGQAAALTTERLESDTALGVRIERGGRSILVAFRKPGIPGEAELAGIKFTGSMAVK